MVLGLGRRLDRVRPDDDRVEGLVDLVRPLKPEASAAS